jgi:hypothetical protein
MTGETDADLQFMVDRRKIEEGGVAEEFFVVCAFRAQIGREDLLN